MELFMPTRVYSEENCVCVYGKELATLGQKAMIVTGKHSSRKNGALQDVIRALDENETAYVIFDRIEENPSVETVMQARMVAIEEKADFFIGIGGGSPMDAAKAISLMAANPEENDAILYTPKKLQHYPVVCVPTTCGTGSEVTPYAILTRHAQHTKKSISHRIYPALALLDAKYIAYLSRCALINTCVDTLAHLLESYLNTNSNELNKIYTREGLKKWAGFKNKLAQNNVSAADHWQMLHASMIAGMAITHTGTSLPHGLSYPLTYELGLPHGRAVGIFLGGFVDNYPSREDATEAAMLLGFANTREFRNYLNNLLGATHVPEELINTSVDKILRDPGKLKNYPFNVNSETLRNMKTI